MLLDNGQRELLDDPILDLFISVREMEVYYQSLRYVDEKRTVHDDASRIFNRFYKLYSDTKSLDILDPLVHQVREGNRVVNHSDNLLNEFRNTDREGFQMLGLREADLTVSGLKRKFREAARRHHPDVGGTVKDMQILNAAFTRFHSILLSILEGKEVSQTGDPSLETILEEMRWASYPKTGNEYCLHIAIILIGIYLDDLAIDQAEHVFGEIKEGLLFETNLWKNTKYHFRCDELFSKLSQRLVQIGAHDKAQDVIVFSEQMENWLPYHREMSRNVFSGKVKQRIVIKSQAQASNALRLGLIDQKRYEKTVEKLVEKKKENVEQKALYAEYSQNQGFINPLPYDSRYFLVGTSDSLVPAPEGYASIVEVLTKEQLQEYFHAFSVDGNWNLGLKYLWVRITSYIGSLVHFLTEINKSKYGEELRLLERVYAKKNGHLKDLNELAEYLWSLEPSVQGLVLKKLQSLYCHTKPVGFIGITIEIRGTNKKNYEKSDYPNPYMSPRDYLLAAIQCVSIIRAERGGNRILNR